MPRPAQRQNARAPKTPMPSTHGSNRQRRSLRTHSGLVYRPCCRPTPWRPSCTWRKITPRLVDRRAPPCIVEAVGQCPASGRRTGCQRPGAALSTAAQHAACCAGGRPFTRANARRHHGAGTRPAPYPRSGRRFRLGRRSRPSSTPCSWMTRSRSLNSTLSCSAIKRMPCSANLSPPPRRPRLTAAQPRWKSTATCCAAAASGHSACLCREDAAAGSVGRGRTPGPDARTGSGRRTCCPGHAAGPA